MYYVHGEKCIKCDILEDAVYTFLAMDGYNQGYKSIGIEYEANGLPCACDVIVMYGGKEVRLSNDYRYCGISIDVDAWKNAVKFINKYLNF